MAQYLIVDPPSGWMYGFPKAIKSVPDGETLHTFDWSSLTEVYKKLLEASGYPAKDIDFALEHSRFWIE